MKRVKRTAILLAVMIISISLVLSSCSFIKKNPQPDSETVVAMVGGEKIMKSEFNQIFDTFKVQYEQLYGADIWDSEIDGRKYIDVMKEKVLDMLVDIKIQEKESIKAGLTATDEEVEAEIENARKYFDSEEKFNEFLASQNMTLEYLKDTIRKDILVSKLQEKLTADVEVTDEEVAAFYASNQDQFVSVKASHILVETEEEAKKLLERIKNNEDFNELAYEFSIDPTAKENKGDLGYFRKGVMVESFETAAFALKPGEVSEPVKSEFGYHLIKVEDKKYEKLEDVAAELKISMLESKKENVYQGLLEDMRAKADIKKYPKNL